jgi:probable HAF family extracellular repeat protein
VINASGQVAFDAGIGLGQDTYVYTNGSYVALVSLGGSLTSPAAINDQGQVVGTSQIAVVPRGSPSHAFLYSGGPLQDLGTLGGPVSGALGINDAGEIVGNSRTATSGFDTDGFLYANGTMYDLNNLTTGDAGYVINSAVAINADGQIAADATTPSGQEHAVLLTPTSTPSAIALPPAVCTALAALPLLLFGKRIRRVLA